MRKIFAVAIVEEEPPLLCPAADEEEAIEEAKMRAEELQLPVRDRIEVSLEGEYPDLEDFCTRFSTLSNPYDEMAGLDGQLFGWTDAEWTFVRSVSPQRVWTFLEGESLCWICPGIHYVNRLGYLVTHQTRGTSEPDFLCD